MIKAWMMKPQSAWLAGWTYRKSVTLSRASGAVSNYQMKILLGESSGATGEDVDCDSKCATDFDDIRFTTSDGATLLDYWIESISGATPNQLATIWVEFGSIGTGATTFYMYYGNAGAAAYSSGPDTFIFHDHFDGDLSKWSGDTAKATIASSICSIKNSAPGVVQIKSTTTAGKANFALRTLGKVKQQINAYDLIGASNAAGSESCSVYNEANTNRLSTIAGGVESLVTSNWTSNSFVIWDLLVIGGTSVRLFENGTEKTGSPKTTYPPNSTAMSARLLAYNSFSVCAADWILLRNYEATEPAWGAWGAQET
jgi:hypothetical protein